MRSWDKALERGVHGDFDQVRVRGVRAEEEGGKAKALNARAEP